MAPLEPWEKVLVSEDYLASTHGFFRCTYCHGGVQSEDKDAAHAGMVPNPVMDATLLCGDCHEDVVASYSTALHNTQGGYMTVLDARSAPAHAENMDEMFGNHCATCHTSCGECHISQPDNVGGGLLNGHMFEKSPPMTRTCTACHGSRVGAEFLGKHEEIPGDVHFREGRMNCVTCHDAASVHASPEGSDTHRYDGEQLPACEDCHKVGGSDDPITQHAIHGDKLSCQVCHSVQYSSCDNCHVEKSAKTGSPIFKTDATYLGFYIGLNARQDEDRPYAYVPVRHVPIDMESFSYYGEDMLPNFNALPTWAYATPHNIQRVTPQNKACENCHGNSDIFLTADKVAGEELEANQNVIVSQPPAAVE